MNKSSALTLIVLLIVLFAGYCNAAQQEPHSAEMGKFDYSAVDAMETADDPALYPAPQTTEKKKAPSNSISVHTDGPGTFDRGYTLFESGKYRKALPHLYRYLSMNSPDDVDYEWAEFFFGISLMRCGFSHAAVDILSHLVTRKPSQRIVSYCLDLFEGISRTLPFDRDLIINKVICDQEYGFVGKRIADFINYYQGVFDWEHGFFSWGNSHFDNITPETYYYYKYLYKEALFKVYQDQVDDAVVILKEIIASEDQADDLRGEALKTLARLFYEKGRFEESITAYQQIEKPILKQAGNLLERAWDQYRMGNPEKAMGLLYAFEAPSFQDYFTPEYYLLKSFIYKDVCHYGKVFEMVNEFRRRYKSSLENIYNRGNAVGDPALLLVLLKKKRINETWKFLRHLERENTQCGEIQDKPLREYLEKIYDLQLAESVDHFRKQVREEYEKTANELLQYEEEAHLMEYEIGLDISKRVYQFRYAMDAPQEKEKTASVVSYPFQGEFWNDELSDYKVILPNKCECMEEWDIFFK